MHEIRKRRMSGRVQLGYHCNCRKLLYYFSRSVDYSIYITCLGTASGVFPVQERRSRYAHADTGTEGLLNAIFNWRVEN